MALRRNKKLLDKKRAFKTQICLKQEKFGIGLTSKVSSFRYYAYESWNELVAARHLDVHVCHKCKSLTL